MSVLLGLGDGTFAGQVGFGTGEGSWAIAAGDLNADGHLDVAVANLFSDDVSVLLGDGDGALAPQARFPVGGGPDGIAIADLDRDGRQDLVVANLSGDVSILLGQGHGVGDFNGDAKPDPVVLRNERTGHGEIRILLGSGDGEFSQGMITGVGLWPQSVAVGEFDGDGRPDLAVDGDEGRVAVMLGTGNGGFTPPPITERATTRDP